MARRLPKVILSEHLSESAARWLDKRTNLVRVSHEDVKAFNKELATAQGLVVRTYTQVNKKLLERAPKLKVVGRAGVGLDNISLSACKQRGVQVVYTPDANTQAVVEYTIGLICDATRPRLVLPQYVDPLHFHQMRKDLVGRQLDTLVLGVLGMGRIGRRVAAAAHAIGMRVIYNDLKTRRQLNLPDEDASEFVDKDTLYKEADILTIHVDGRRSNKHLIDADVLEQLKKNCIVLNAARGMLIDNDALADWAKRTARSGSVAYLDVHDPEPPPDDYPLYGIKNVKLLPHLASRTPQAMENMSWVVRDVVAVLEGRPPQWPAG